MKKILEMLENLFYSEETLNRKAALESKILFIKELKKELDSESERLYKNGRKPTIEELKSYNRKIEALRWLS